MSSGYGAEHGTKNELPPQKLAGLPHVLVVDDDDRIRQLLSRYLQDQGFIACTASDAAVATALMEQLVFDALVVDVMMPGQNGLDFTRALRDGGCGLPVLLLTALNETEDRLSGFENGADDYLPKPFEPQELVFRLRSLLRRRGLAYREEGEGFKVGVWYYEPDHAELVDDDGARRVKLTAVEVNLLEALASRAGEVVSRDDLAAMCKMDAGERTIDVQVTRLRRKIEEDTKSPRYLQTVRGKGYLLRIEKQ